MDYSCRGVGETYTSTSKNEDSVMLNFAFTQSGAMYSLNALPYLVSPLCAILLLTLGVVLFLDAVDEMLNPRLRRR